MHLGDPEKALALAWHSPSAIARWGAESVDKRFHVSQIHEALMLDFLHIKTKYVRFNLLKYGNNVE